MSERWQPSADLETLRTRARVLQIIRDFFREREVLEVETPVLSRFAATDLHLNSLATQVAGVGNLYLHVSPEFFMKRLLAAGSGDIWQCCRVYRDGEAGRYHNPEFTMVEWYRLGTSTQELMAEVVDLIEAVTGPRGEPFFYTYTDLFERHLGLDPLHADIHELTACADRHGFSAPDCTREQYLDWLFSDQVCPHLPSGNLIFVDKFPARQAALASLSADGLTAERFECFLGPLEIANGYHEARDADEIKQRFESDNAQRKQAGLPEMPPDMHLLQALEHGLPDCSGVALGLDRLLMVAADKAKISEVTAFALDRI